MEETMNSIVKLEEATRWLAEIQTVDEAKAIADKAEALRIYAKRAKLGLEAQNHAAKIKTLAQLREGELLKELNVSKNGLATLNRVPVSSELIRITTLAELGITANESSDTQVLAEAGEEAVTQMMEQTEAEGKEISTAKMVKSLRKKRQKTKKAERKKTPLDIPKDDRYLLIPGDIAEVTKHIDPPDIIITDPPYPREYLYLYGVLAETAAAILSPGGSLLVMTGQSYLPEIIELMKPHLNYQWALAYLTPGGQAVQLWDNKVITFWKPVLWFVKGKYKGDWIGDVIKSAVNDNDKRYHDWGQSESGMAELIEKFTDPGQTILDPFCGGGTTGVVAVRLNRRFIGIDIDPEAIRTTAERLSREVAS